jgi:hypothetical protein
MAFKDDFKFGCFSHPFFRPPPERLDLSGGRRSSSFNSLIPRMIVGREIPVARETIEIAPWPKFSVSAAAHSRRCRSFNVLLSMMNFLAIISSKMESPQKKSYQFNIVL